MAAKKVLADIKNDLDAFVGKRIRLKANRGRKRIVEREGILERTYPHVFVVKLDEKRNTAQRVSYSYTDVLTETVEWAACSEESSVKSKAREA